MPALMKRTFRKQTLVAMLFSTALLAGCAGGDPEARFKTASIENDYRLRHPIQLAEAQHTLDLPVGSGERRLNAALADSVRGFGQEYAAASATGVVQVALPSGSINTMAAHAVAPDIRKALVAGGIKANRIYMATYPAPQGGVSAPVRLAFVAVTAMTDECGTWPEDLMNNSMGNTNWHNFGCASQNNLAAQVANSQDLYSPRGETPIDAENRKMVIENYRKNGNGN